MQVDPAVQTTRRLVQSIRSPREGFAALHQRNAARLALWADVHVGPTLRALVATDDLVQEVWTRAYAAFATFDRQRGDFRAWLFGIAYNVLREHLRSLRVDRARRWRDPGLEPAPVDPVDGATSVASQIAAADGRAVLAAAIAELPADDRRLVVWRGLEELSYAEIGARLGLGATAVESRWRRLRDRLRDALPRALAGDWLGD